MKTVYDRGRMLDNSKSRKFAIAAKRRRHLQKLLFFQELRSVQYGIFKKIRDLPSFNDEPEQC